MKAAVYYGPEKMVIEDAPMPKAGKDELVLRVMSCAICGTDLRIYRHGHKKVSPPHIIGHEVAGIVEEAGSEVENYKEGQRVSLVTEVGCDVCRWCREGRKNLCPEMKAFGYYYPGGFAQFMKIPGDALRQNNLLPIPEPLSFEEASLIEPLSCCVNGQEYLGICSGEKVVVIGAGPIGLMHAELAKEKGAEIILIDVSSDRLQMARDFSISHFIDASCENSIDRVMEITGAEGADVVIVACASAKAQEDAIRMAGIRGRVSLFGGLPPENSRINIDANIIHYREIGIFGAFASSNHQYVEALDIISKKNLDLKKFITASYSLKDIEKGLKILIDGRAIKVVIKP